VLMAAYTALLRMRENRELLVLFASGLGPFQLGALVVLAGLAAQLIAISGSGVIDPMSRFAQRAILFGTELQSLKKGLSNGEFYYFPSYVAYTMDHITPELPDVPSGQVIDARGAEVKHTLFVYQQIAPHTSRVVTAAKARLDGPDRSGRVILNLNDFTSHTFADAYPLLRPSFPSLPGNNLPGANLPSESSAGDRTAPANGGVFLDGMKDTPPITMNVRDMSQLMMVDQLLPFGPRGSDTAEQTIFEQLRYPKDGTADQQAAQMRLLAERFGRSLLCFLAPLLALAAVCLTSRLTNWFALPAACLALMAVNLACEWLITEMTPLDVARALLPPLILFAGVAGAAVTIIGRRQGALVQPQLTRS